MGEGMHTATAFSDTYLAAHTLLVSDAAKTVAECQKILCAAGYQLHIASGSNLRLQLAQHQTPDIVLLDASLSQADAYALCRLLKASPPWSMIPLLMLVPADDQAVITQALACGADDILPM